MGNASLPDVLEEADAKNAEMIVAVTHSDEVNMVACQVAHSLFNVPEKIARVRHQSYLNPAWADLFNRDNMPIDLIISPEIEVARAIERRLQVPGALDMLPFCGGRLRVIAVRCEEGCPIINTPLRQLTELFPDLNIMVVAISRDSRLIVPRGRRPDADRRRGLFRRRLRACCAQHGRLRARRAGGPPGRHHWRPAISAIS